jgi:hypothetical protein
VTGAGTATALREPAAAAPPKPRGATALSRLRPGRAGTTAALLAVLLIGVAAVTATGLLGWPPYVDDEGTYVAQAWAVLVEGRLAHYTYWYDHPPLGWVQIAAWAGATGAFGRYATAIGAGREAMVVVTTATAGLVFALSRRLGLRRSTAFAAVALFALSPIGLRLHRMVYLDNVAVLWVVAAFVLVLSPRRRLGAYLGAAVAFAVAVLSKETALLFAPALLVACVQHTRGLTRRFCVTALVAGSALLLAGYPLYAALKGELLPGPDHVSLLEAVRFQLFTRAGSGSVLDPASPAAALVRSWLREDPLTLVGGAVAAVVALGNRRLRGVALALLTVVASGLRPGYLPEPHVTLVLPFAAVLLAASADRLWSLAEHARRRVARRAATVLLLVAVVSTGLVLPAWAARVAAAPPGDHNAALTQAVRWIEANVARDQRILVDDTVWVDLVEAGFEPRYGVVWHYKLDFTNNLDPSVQDRLPGGWREFDYVLSTPTLRRSVELQPDGLDEVREALQRSIPLATFGAGENEMRVSRVLAPGG